MTKSKLKVTIAAPPHREKHVAEIGFWDRKVIQPGTDSSWWGVGEIVIDNGFFEFQVYPASDDSEIVVDYQELVDALNEGKERLLEIYPDMDKS